MIHAFKFNDIYLMLDVESGALHCLDKEAYEVVLEKSEGRDPYALPYDKSEVDEILHELDTLKDDGAYEAEELTPPASAAKPVIKSMCIHIAHDCNLRCRYCFAGTGEFHGERMLMSEEIANKSLDFLIEHSGNRHNLEVDLFGGEPLMNFSVVKSVVAHGRELEKKYNKKINFTITTNGIALDDEKIDYINREMHNVVISLDGRQEIHDALRPTANGKGSYELIVPHAQELVKRRGDGEHYIRGTFTNRNIDFTNDVKALLDLGFKQISIEPVVLPADSPYALLPEHLAAIEAEYDKLAEFVIKRRAEGKWFNFFHFMIDLSGGPCLKKRLTGCGAGSEYVAVSPEGDIYPCHQFVGEKEYLMGNVATGEFDERIQKEFAECNVLTKPVCHDCWAKYFCSGGCAANAYKYNGDIHKPHEMTCALLKKRTECALGIYAKER